MDSLTKENFWNELHAKYPQAVDKFCKWIDEYKKEVDWGHLILHFPHGHQKAGLPRKFHDLPFDIQIGILMRYIEEHHNVITREEYIERRRTMITQFFSDNQNQE